MPSLKGYSYLALTARRRAARFATPLGREPALLYNRYRASSWALLKATDNRDGSAPHLIVPVTGSPNEQSDPG